MRAFPTTQEAISDIVRESLLVKQAILANAELIETIAKVSEQMTHALHAGRKILFFGNGGSAADAQHMAAEFVGRFVRERRAPKGWRLADLADHCIGVPSERTARIQEGHILIGHILCEIVDESFA